MEDPDFRCHMCGKGICGKMCIPEHYHYQGQIPQAHRVYVCMVCHCLDMEKRDRNRLKIRNLPFESDHDDNDDDKERAKPVQVPCACGDKCRKKNLVDAENPEVRCQSCGIGICGSNCIPLKYHKLIGSSNERV